ncbi:MAG: universal stress protein [Pseudomonadota bacterium]
MPSSILIPVALDHEGHTKRKLEVARALLDPGGRITLLTVLESIPPFVAEFVTVKEENRLTDRIMEILRSAAGGAPDIDCRTTTGKPGIKIVEVAKEIGCDLIVVGAHHPNAAEYFLGSTAARVTRRANCDVYVLR